ncbi:MAG: hypothetical protein Q8O64_04020 [Sideroxyarcus sp.]|nr:hypothetical protein [Sideroxyarcus sp.]
MSFSTGDIAEIKWSLLACLLALVCAVVLFNYSTSFEQQAQQKLVQAKRLQTDAQNQLVNAQSDLENMASYQMEYDALVAQKVIGTEQRLDWIEGLEKLRAQKLVPGFQYTVAPQQPYAPKPPLQAGNFALNISPMNLQIDLLHEEQLLRFFKAMETQLQGWFLLDHCSLARSETGDSGVATLTAECAGGWFTMKNRSAP